MPVSLNKNTLIRTEKCCFLIMDAPTNNNLAHYIEQMKKHNVTALVRACKPSYDKAPVEKVGIQVEDMCFADGTSPPDDVLTRWLELTETQFRVEKSKKKKSKKKNSNENKGNAADECPAPKENESSSACVAVHCVAGLGRAPVLVALALMEIERMDAFSAIEQIRSKRRGAFNATQIDFLEKYKRRRSKKVPECLIM